MEFLRVGKIVNTHGLRGEVRVQSITDFPEKRYRPNQILWVDNPSAKGKKEKLVIKSHRKHKQFDLLTFVGKESINGVEQYKTLTLWVDKKEAKADHQDDSYFFDDLIGCTVMSTDGIVLGEISEILQPGANDVWVVTSSNRKPLYLPAIKDVVVSVDATDKKITVNIIEGLLD